MFWLHLREAALLLPCGQEPRSCSRRVASKTGCASGKQIRERVVRAHKRSAEPRSIANLLVAR
ncbi:hypothetical protein GCM10011491_41570 [Brucella endophytica]|uniref:Uncharacterized protein n=1 Tax=Brucella endophytica TaxID=1963359 RepID=A0A916SR62_9HYPH|nr:hypothetical protein GCM10011491_41570 [Brucella endophytica]